jgi:omega-hydroxypalmitate O-feruloyl transferase
MATQHENYQTVSVTKTVSASPKVLLHPKKILSLSNLDRQCPSLMYLVFFYNPSPAYKNLSLNLVFSSLKAGLEETLLAWYPAAGRLCPNQGDGKLDLWCNNDGAVLVEAVTHVKISELGDLSQYNKFFEKLVYKPVFDGNFSKMPLVVAQVRILVACKYNKLRIFLPKTNH